MKRRGGGSAGQRQLRVGEQLRHALAGILARGDFRDPALRGVNVTVTEVRVSPDLKHATAFVTPLGGEALEETVKALNHASAFLRTRLAGEVDMRFTPQLRFAADRSFDQAERMHRLLQRPRVQQDLADVPSDGDGEPPEGDDGTHGA